jgi:hypothetical protein
MRKALLPFVYKGSRAFWFVWNVLVGNELAKLSYGVLAQPPTLRFGPGQTG